MQLGKTKQQETYTCQSCGYQKCKVILDLGSQPICNKFLRDPSEFVNEKKYPLKLIFCPRCKLVQLSELPPREEVFGEDYNYLSGASPSALKFFEETAKKLVKTLGLKPGDLVLDIGSNDGSLLLEFKKLGMRVLGVEPAPKPAQIAIERGIDTIIGYFEDSISKIKQVTGGEIKLITAFNVLAHTDRIHQFLEGVKELLNDDSVFVSSSHYLKSLVDNLEWDTIYHEHARYYSLTSLDYLFRSHSIHIFDAEITDYYGGSILVYASIKEKRRSERLEKLISEESYITKYRYLKNFARRVIKNSSELRALLYRLKSEGKRIVGLGAPMKSSTLLNFCGCDNKVIDYLVEVNPLKIGTYSPGTHIKVVSEDFFLSDKSVDYALILSWNIAEYIIEKYRSKGYKGKFIIPIPEVKII